jgi:hypothetical protein
MRYGEFRRRLAVPTAQRPDGIDIAVARALLAQTPGALSEDRCLALLSCYGLPMTRDTLTPDAAMIADAPEMRVAIVRDATRKYLKDHLGRWAPAFAARLESKAQDGPYAALARLLANFIAEDTLALNVTPVPAAAAPLAPQPDDELAICDGCAEASVFNPAMRGEP